MPSLIALPLAAQRAICRALDVGDRCSLLRCSRHFYDLLLPVVYERVVLPNGERIAPLAWMLCSKANLALSLRSLQLCDWMSDRPIDIENARPYDNLDQEIAAFTDDTCLDPLPDSVVVGGWEYDFAAVRERVKAATRTDREVQFWMKDLIAFNKDAWAALLLTLLPNLTRLELQFPTFSKYVPWVLDRAANSQFESLPVLESLECVFLDWWDVEGGLISSEAVSFFHLPNMRRFYANMLAEDRIPSPPSGEHEVGSTSPITHVEMNMSSGTNGFRNLLPRCKNLVSFKYCHESGLLFGSGGDFNMENMYESLIHARNTLETLWLDFEDTPAGMQEDEDGGIASFAEFKALKHLHIHASMLSVLDPYEPEVPVIRDILPQGIEKLYMSGIDLDYAKELVSGLEKHLSSDREHTPQLKEVIIEGELEEIEFQSLRRAAAEAGIDFRVRERGMQDWKWEGDNFADYPFPCKV